jgi:hypothetical protein
MRYAAAALLLSVATVGLADGRPPRAAVHRLAGDAGGIFANSYLVETPSGVVVIDGRLLTSEG